MSKMNLRKAFLTTAAAGAMLLGMAAESANAIPISGLLVGGDNLLSDNSAEYLIKGAGNLLPTTIQVGDRLRGIASIGTIENNVLPPGGVSIGGTTVYNELTVLFDITVASKAGAPGAFAFSFAPTPGFDLEVAGLGFTGSTVGAMAAFFTDPANNYTRTLLTDTGVAPGTQTTAASIAADRATMEALASDGTPFWLFGQDGVDDFWNATAITDSIAIAATAPLNTPFGQFAIGLSKISDGIGPELGSLGPTGCLNLLTLTFSDVNVCGNGGLLAKGPTDGGVGGGTPHLNSAMDSFDDVNFNIRVVPEPGTLGLFGFSLLGLGFMAKRRQKKA